MDVVIAEAIGIVVCLICSAYFSGSETALTSLSDGQIERLIEEKGMHSLRLWRDKPLVVLTSILIGNNIFNITASALATDLAARLLGSTSASQWAIPAAIGAMTFLLLTFGEITPKTIARVRNQQLAGALMWPMRVPVALFFPATFFFNKLAAGVMRLVGGNVNERQPFGTNEDFQFMIDVGSREGQITEGSERLLRSVFEFPDTVVREIMVPRTDMVAIPEEITLEEVLEVLMECGHSRIPVYRETIDDIVGLFYAKDVIQLMATRQDFELSRILRRTYFVPATKRISDLLAEFQINRIHMAVVVDEFGGTAGLITLEDIIEEFFGDIQDEYDTEPAQIIAVDDVRVMADARVPIYELEDYYDIELPEHPDYESLGGFLLSQSGSVPEPGDEIVWNDLHFRVIDADAKRVISVEIERRPAEQDEAEELVS